MEKLNAEMCIGDFKIINKAEGQPGVDIEFSSGSVGIFDQPESEGDLPLSHRRKVLADDSFQTTSKDQKSQISNSATFRTKEKSCDASSKSQLPDQPQVQELAVKAEMVDQVTSDDNDLNPRPYLES